MKKVFVSDILQPKLSLGVVRLDDSEKSCHKDIVSESQLLLRQIFSIE